MRHRRAWGRTAGSAIALLAALLGACATHTAPAGTSAANRESLLALSWVRNSLEYPFLAEQTYRAATAALDRAVSEPGTAALEQSTLAGFAALPPAVVMDIDETTIDTSAFSARLLREGRYFDRDVAMREWPAFLRDPGSGEAVPGAVGFVQAARARGLRVIFVTNRDCPVPAPDTAAPQCTERTAAVQALARLGIPDVREADLWTTGGVERWPTDKSSRRAAIARTHRIVMLVGDDLQDFVPQAVAERMRSGTSVPLPDLFGSRWFLLPNPVYGSWERFAARECTQGGARPDLGYRCHERAVQAGRPRSATVREEAHSRD
jgi:acid phosphatase